MTEQVYLWAANPILGNAPSPRSVGPIKESVLGKAMAAEARSCRARIHRHIGPGRTTQSGVSTQLNTEAQDDALRRYEAGESMIAIAKAHGVAKSTVSDRIRRARRRRERGE